MNRHRVAKRRAPSKIKADLGVAWYKPEQWERLRNISADANDLEVTYEEWVHNAEKGIRMMRELDMRPEIIEVDVEELFRWCQAHHSPVDSGSRAQYVADQLRQRHQGTSRSESPKE